MFIRLFEAFTLSEKTVDIFVTLFLAVFNFFNSICSNG